MFNIHQRDSYNIGISKKKNRVRAQSCPLSHMKWISLSSHKSDFLSLFIRGRWISWIVAVGNNKGIKVDNPFKSEISLFAKRKNASVMKNCSHDSLHFSRSFLQVRVE